jgi:hypothetical protein
MAALNFGIEPELAVALPPEAPLHCELCFASDHSQERCRLVVPAAAGAAGSEDDEEEDDPEELVFGSGSSDGGSGDDLQAFSGEDGFIPLAGEDDFLPAPEPDEPLPDAEDLEEPERPDYADVFMPHSDMPHFEHLAYAFVNPPLQAPVPLIHQAASRACGPHRVSLLSSSRGARIAVFASALDRENAVSHGPFIGQEASVHFERHDETDNRFIFQHEAMVALAIEDFPLEHWGRDRITSASVPFANPHSIDPICLTGLDYSAVLVTVKAESVHDIPLNLAVKNHNSIGTMGRVIIIDSDDLSSGSDPSDSEPDLSPVPDALSDGEFEMVELQGGCGYAEVLSAIGAPPPGIPHGAPSSAAPAASMLSRALAAAPPLPSVQGEPLRSKPAQVTYKFHLGYFDVSVLGSLGERVSFRLPLRRAAADRGCKGLMVVNLSTASVGIVDSIATVGPLKRLVLTSNVLVRGDPMDPELEVAAPTAISFLMGTDDMDASDQLLLESPSAPRSAARAPLLAPALLGAPVLDTVWHSPSPSKPRRSSRLALVEQANFISVVDRAVLRKKARMEGGEVLAPSRQGELPSDDLIAVAIEDGKPMPEPDVLVLADACDIPAGALLASPTCSLEMGPSP